ncbi:MAG: Shedu anti-phage system protein SduA domain-containing protein [Terriglobales bacterium]
MFDKHQPTERDLRRTRDEFRNMLEERTKETQWQNFFSDNPFVLSMSLPLRLTPQDIVPMGRPGRAEPDFVFYSKNLEPLPTYGVIEIKRPDSAIITVTRSNAAILSRDAETAIQQATDYSLSQQKNQLQAKQESVLILGNQAHLFVIMGMSTELGRKLSLELYKEMIEKRLPPNLRLIPYDTLLRGFEAQVPTPLHILVPALENDPTPSTDDEGLASSIDRVMVERAIEALPPGYRIIYVLHDIEGYDHGDIREMLGSSIDYNKRQLYKARTKLTSILQDITGLPPEPAKKIIEALRKEFAQNRQATGVKKRG